MICRRYQKEDFDEVVKWGQAVGSTYDPDLLPEIGFIVPNIAVFFLYQTDSHICFLENLVSNPEILKEVRDIAITSIIDNILWEAHQLGYKVCYSCTNLPKVVDRALKYGCQIDNNYTLLQFKLN